MSALAVTQAEPRVVNGARVGEDVAQAAIVGLLYAVPALLCLVAANVSDPDVWWHLSSGEWILQHHAIPRTDPFSAYAAGKPWAAYSWLFDVGIQRLFGQLGLSGIVAYTTGMVLATTVALRHMLKRLHADFTLVVLLTFVAALSMGRLYTPRPWHLTILLFVVELDILMHARRTGRIRELMWLPVLFALWANVHIQFVDGLVLLGIVAAEAVMARWWLGARTGLKASWALATLGVCVLATLVNPYGWGIYRVAHDLAAQPGVMDHIGELQAIPFRGVPDFCVLALALGAAASLARARRAMVFEAALLMLAAYLSFRSQRDVWVMAVVGSAIIAGNLRSKKVENGAVPMFTRAVIACTTAAMLLIALREMHVTNERLSGDLAKTLPVEAVRVVQARGYAGPLYNDYIWGGYLEWARLPVSIDGRAALAGDARIDRFNVTWAGEPGWTSDQELARAGLVLGPVRAPLTQLLRMDGRFDLAYEDQVAAVFVRRK